MTEYTDAPIQFLIGKNGQIEVGDFEPRTMKMALKPFLAKGWKKNPKLLVKAMRQSPDLMGMVLSIRNGFAGFLEEKRVDIEVQIGEKTEMLLKELDEEAKSKFDPMNDEELTRQYELLNIVDLFLWSIEENSLPDWVASLVPEEYAMIVDLLKKTLKGDVTEDSYVFNPAYDTPEGAAVTLMMELSPERLDELDIRFGWADMVEAPLAVSTGMDPDKMNEICENAGLNVRFAKKDAPKAKAKAKAEKAKKPAKDEVTDVTPVEAPAAKPAETKKAAAKPTAKKTAPKATAPKAPAKKAPDKKSPAKAAAVKPAATEATAAPKTADKPAVKPAAKPAAKKAAAPKPAAKPAAKSPAKKAPAAKPAAKKAAAAKPAAK